MDQQAVAFSGVRASVSSYSLSSRTYKQPSYPYQLRAHLGRGLVLGQCDVGEVRRVSDDARVGVAKDVGLPLPARRVRVASADVLGLQALELLLVTKLVRLEHRVSRAYLENNGQDGCLPFF